MDHLTQPAEGQPARAWQPYASYTRPVATEHVTERGHLTYSIVPPLLTVCADDLRARLLVVADAVDELVGEFLGIGNHLHVLHAELLFERGPVGIEEDWGRRVRTADGAAVCDDGPHLLWVVAVNRDLMKAGGGGHNPRL